MTGFYDLEAFIGNGMGQVVGDPIFLGLLVLGFLGGFVLLQNTRFDAKLLVIVPAMLLAMAFIPILPLLFGLVCGFIGYLVVTKLENR